MATNKMDAEEFQFPDEKEEVSAAADDFEIEIEDDTPVEDRGRKTSKPEFVEKVEKDELDLYSQEARSKIK